MPLSLPIVKNWFESKNTESKERENYYRNKRNGGIIYIYISLEVGSFSSLWFPGFLYYLNTVRAIHCPKSNPNFRDITWNAVENMTLYKNPRSMCHVFPVTFHVISRKIDFLRDSVHCTVRGEDLPMHIAHSQATELKTVYSIREYKSIRERKWRTRFF